MPWKPENSEFLNK